MFRLTALAFAACALAPPALSQTVALVVSNESYRSGITVEGSRSLASAAGELGEAGVDLFTATDAIGAPTLESFEGFARRAAEASSAIAILSGAYVHSDFDTWLTPVGMATPAVGGLVQRALPLSAVMTVLSGVDGPAMAIVASGEELVETGPFIRPGLGDFEAPDNVLLVRTTPERAERIVREVLLSGDEALADALARFGDIASDEMASERLLGTGTERAAWLQARERDTIEAYRGFLDRYPDGDFALEAQLRLYQLDRDPQRQAERQEAALNLTRDARQAVQGDLSVLGYDTRGIDGIFGPGTRNAIEAWQRENDYAATGYMTASQIDVLARQADDRLQEQEREAARRAQEDREWWQQTGETGTAQGYLRYLERYPNGRFSDLAQERLDELARDLGGDQGQGEGQGQGQGQGEGPERQAWNAARQTGTADAYRAYLDTYPDGAFADQARQRLGQLEGRDMAAIEAARQAEGGLNLGPLGRQLAESRLEDLGLRPGPVDGEFDDATRSAIRRFQSERGLESTGYLDQATVARLLAGGLQNLFE